MKVIFQASLLRAIALIAGVLGSVVVARLGGAEVKGVQAAFAASVIGLFTLVNLDLAQQVLRDARATKFLNGARRRYLAFTPIHLCLASIAALGCWLFGYGLYSVVALGACTYLVTAHLGVISNGIRGPWTTALGAVIQQVALITGTLIAFVLGVLNAVAIPTVVSASFLAPLPLYYWASRPRVGNPTRPTASGSTRRGLVREGIRWQPVRMLQFSLLRMDTLLVYACLGASSAGVYSVGLATAQLAGIIPAQFAAKATYDGARSEATSIHSTVKWSLIAGGLGAGSLALIGSPLLEIAYGPHFDGSYVVMLLALPGIAAYGVLQSITNYMRLTGERRDIMIPSAVGVGVMSVTLLALIPTLGMPGAAIASSAGSACASLTAWLRHRATKASEGSA